MSSTSRNTVKNPSFYCPNKCTNFKCNHFILINKTHWCLHVILLTSLCWEFQTLHIDFVNTIFFLDRALLRGWRSSVWATQLPKSQDPRVRTPGRTSSGAARHICTRSGHIWTARAVADTLATATSLSIRFVKKDKNQIQKYIVKAYVWDWWQPETACLRTKNLCMVCGTFWKQYS